MTTNTIAKTKLGLNILVPATPAKYRKTSKGEWVVIALAADLEEAKAIADPHSLATILVTKNSGETISEAIKSVGRPFTKDGNIYAYGYILGMFDNQ